MNREQALKNFFDRFILLNNKIDIMEIKPTKKTISKLKQRYY